MRWQRILRPFLGLFALGFAIWVVIQIRDRRVEPGATDTGRTDPNAVVESTKGQSIMHKGAKQDVRIDYERLLTYAQGRSKFFGAKISVLDRGGRNFEVTANEAEVAENQSQIDLRGAVVITASDGLVVKTDTATYTQSDQVMRAPGPVTFARARMTGSSVGASYDQARDVLWLLDQARITVAPDQDGTGGTAVTAGAAGYARRDRYLRFDRGVHMVRGNQSVDADGAVAYLREDADVLTLLELRGHSRVSGVGQGANGLEAMTARDINLQYSEDGQLLQHAVLTGDAVLQLASGTGTPGQRLASQAIDIAIGPDGQTVQALGAQDAVQLDLPAAGNAPSRQIRSTALDAQGEPGSPGLKLARFSGGVEFRETQAAAGSAPASQRVVKAKSLETALLNGLASIDKATFTDGVTVQDGPRTATGPTLVYDVGKGGLALAGLPSDERAYVQVIDEGVNIEARTLDWTVDGTKMVADGRVRSVLKPTGGTSDGKVKRPSMFAGDQPVNVTASHLVYNRESGRAEYSGEARLWQQQTSIKATTITLDESTGNLMANGNVQSVMRVESTEPATATTPGASATNGTPPAGPAGAGGAGAIGSGPTRPGPGGGTAAGRATTPATAARPATGEARKGTDTMATAADLVYDDGQRRATYTGTARMVGEAGDLRGAKIEIYFDESGKGLERLEAYESVAFQSAKRPDGSQRWGHGARLTYFAADERYVLSGKPSANVIEQLPKECRETVGRMLTFYKATDSILVDGNEDRTLTRATAQCPAVQVP